MSKLLRGITAEQYDQAKEVAGRFSEDCVGRQLNVAYTAAIMSLELLIRHTPLTMEDVVEAVEVLADINTKLNNTGSIQVAKVTKDLS